MMFLVGTRRRTIGKTALILAGASLWVLGTGGLAFAQDDGDRKEPEWSVEGELTGKFVANSKSTSSFRQDHNIQTGANLSVTGNVEWDDNRTWDLRGLGQYGEEQGYFVSDYDKLGSYGLIVDFSSWREFYNARTGRLPEAADGTDLDDIFPGTNDGRDIYGGSSPSTDWMTGGFLFDYQPDKYVSNVYGDFHFRRVDGDQTLAKGASVYTDEINRLGGPTFYVDFLLPSQKEVDYFSYIASTGLESQVGNANWQFDISFAQHEFEAETIERNYSFDPDEPPPPALPAGTTSTETEYFIEDSTVQVSKVDLAVARHITPTFYLYGAGMFAYERSDPEPTQDVGGPGFRTETRSTDSSKVERFTPVVSLGSVFQPVPAIVVRVDTSFKYSTQEGRINEFRDESDFDGASIPGNFISRVDRDDYVGRAGVNMDWKFTRRLRGSFDVRYRYRREDVDSSRVTNIVGLPFQIEEFTSDRHRIEAGPSVSYRFNRGRTVEAGYKFKYEDFDVDVDEIEEQIILDDFDILGHRLYARARGRIAGKLRGDMRLEFVHERRDMNQPISDPDIFAVDSAPGETQLQTISFVPTVFYPINDEWNLNASLSIRQVELSIIDSDTSPGNEDLIADFEYEALTETVTVGGTYRPSNEWSGSLTYSLFNSDESVENVGHSARLAGDWRIDDTWRVYGQYGFYLYERDGTSVDDYSAHVVSLGVDARF